MATVTPSVKVTADGVPYVIWSGIVTGDTLVAFAVRDGQARNAAVQI